VVRRRSVRAAAICRQLNTRIGRPPTRAVATCDFLATAGREFDQVVRGAFARVDEVEHGTLFRRATEIVLGSNLNSVIPGPPTLKEPGGLRRETAGRIR